MSTVNAKRDRYVVTYRGAGGHTRQALIRSNAAVADLAADARRQLVGNNLSVLEIVSVQPD